MRILACCFLLSAFFVISCGSKKVNLDMNDQEIYQQAIDELESKSGGFPWIFTGIDYDKIFDSFNELRIRYTYSPYATLAELRTADAYFKKEEYGQATIEYEEFLKRNPGHTESEYATYQLALSHFMRKKSPDRDPTDTREALKWFEVFVEKFPSSELVPQADENMSICKDILAKREIYIGEFYSRRDNYKAAANRYSAVVINFSDTNQYEKALYLLGISYVKEKQYELARQTLQRLVQIFPDKRYHNKANSLLREIEGKQDLQPEEIQPESS